MFYGCGLFIFLFVSLGFLPPYCILFSGIVYTWLFPHPCSYVLVFFTFLCPSFSFVQYIWVSISGLGSLFSSTFVVLGFLSWDDTGRISSY